MYVWINQWNSELFCPPYLESLTPQWKWQKVHIISPNYHVRHLLWSKTLLPTTMSNEPWSPLHFELAFIKITLIDLSFIMITAKPYYVSISKGILCALASPNQRNKTNVPLYDPILMALSKMDKMSGIE